MQNNPKIEILPLCLGCSLICLAWSGQFFFKKQANKLSQISKKLEKAKKEKDKVINLEQLKKQENKGKKVQVVFQRIYPRLKDDTLKIRYREKSLKAIMPEHYTHVSGGEFTFTHKTTNITAQINDAVVLSSILSAKQIPISNFGHMKPVAKSVQYSIKDGLSMAIFGTLSYDLVSNRFKLEAYGMGINLAELINYYDNQWMLRTIPRVVMWLIGGIGAGIIYNSLIKYIKKFFVSKINQNLQIKSLNTEQYFRNKVIFKTNTQNVYGCVKCNKNSTSIIYKCGHLALCEKCHEENKEKNEGKYICPICEKKSKIFMKIYLA